MENTPAITMTLNINTVELRSWLEYRPDPEGDSYVGMSRRIERDSEYNVVSDVTEPTGLVCRGL